FVFLFIFFSFILRPLLSSLFPYTTLFRSLPFPESFIQRNSFFFILFYLILLYFYSCCLSIFNSFLFRFLVFKKKKLCRNKKYRQDRKSTRLNSSHVSISYAVFCLKKKKKK